MLQQTIAILLVLGLLLTALWQLRKRGLATINFAGAPSGIRRPGRADKAMRVIERVVLTPTHSLHLVSIRNRLVVFAVSPAGCQAIDHSLYSFDCGMDKVTAIRDAAS